jgi:cyclopropane-fatty-acyl-phospholipid synthase
MQLLDVGCGWGGMVRPPPATTACGRWASPSRRTGPVGPRRSARRAVRPGRIRLQDCDVRDGPFDAISSIGMFEHVGQSRLRSYMHQLHRLLLPEDGS